MAKDKRDIITSPRIVELQRARRKRNRILYSIIFILFIGLVVGLSYLSGYKKVVISNIVIEGTHIIDSNEVKNKILDDQRCDIKSASVSQIASLRQVTKNRSAPLNEKFELRTQRL